MRASARPCLRAASSRPRSQSCRFVAGRRYPTQQPFHTSLCCRRENDPPNILPFQVIAEPYHGENPKEGAQEVEGAPEDGPDKPSKSKDKKNYGSASRRAGRNIKRVKELPPVHIPPWFLERNVVLSDSSSSSKNDPPSNELLATPVGDSNKANGEAADAGGGTSEDASTSHETNKGSIANPELRLHKLTNWLEVLAAVRAGLQLPSWQRSEVAASLKPHVLLFCPKDGATEYLEKLCRSLAKDCGTDLLRLAPQDIAEVGGDYLEEPSEFRTNTISSLGYDAPLIAASRLAPPPEDPAEEDEDEYDESEEEDIDNADFKPSGFPNNIRPTFRAIHIGNGANLSDVFKSLIPSGASPQNSKAVAIRDPQPEPKDMTPELKFTHLVETLLNTPEIKRAATTTTKKATDSPEPSTEDADKTATKEEKSQETSPAENEHASHGLIVLIEDYPEIHTTANGGKFIEKLHEVVEARRKEGQKVLVVGTASSKSMMPSLNRSGVKGVQSDPRVGPMRTIVTPIDDTTPDSVFEREHKRKIKDINIRHLRDMLRRIAPDFGQVARIALGWELDIDSKTAFVAGLDESVWAMDRVSRTATTALGLLEGSEEMSSKHIQRAMEIIDSSDDGKYDWVKVEKEQRSKKTSNSSNSPGSSAMEDSKERIRKLRKTCNDHEKRLLNGVVHPEDIRTNFTDVQAPPSTIDALKTLTSLSLVRPDAFTYGVLASDRIPGLLLYGPPGTGKTLLARAVAKESGATVLEVSGSDVYDMYVGEGEKNVKAIFSLAKKLTPCIVFIDEADAILGARSGGSNRTSHRELINQFLREWDGMTETSAFIMVATNRPFDLDEASLRRLPRRLLVDLPVEKDREAILKIHLKDEVLDPEVSLSQLASQTPFYSGSDLKNVAVAAALACVREEFEAAAAHAKDTTNAEIYQYPAKRTLHHRHFTKAMDEISASISEDMGSLSAIRKFDEKYGDRRGRRKKGGYGFKTVTESDKANSDAARVRNQT